MKIHYNIIIFVFIGVLSSCKNKNNDVQLYDTNENISTDIDIDHFNIWVNNPEKAKKQLTEIGFTAVPDSLSEIHVGQGTAGRYFHFLNLYLELIFVYNQNDLEQNNTNNENLDFTERANFEKNGASPFSIALHVKEYDVEKIPFEKVTYHQDWMEENADILVAKNSKTYLKEPSIFVVYPKIESDKFESLSDLINIPEEYAFVREFYKHPNGAKKVTKVIITSDELNLNTKTIQAVNSIEKLTVKHGKEHLMEMYFDNNEQGRTFDLRPELPLIIYL